MKTQMQKAQVVEPQETSSYLDELDAEMKQFLNSDVAQAPQSEPASTVAPAPVEEIHENQVPVEVNQSVDDSQGSLKSFIEHRRIKEKQDIEARLNILRQQIIGRWGTQEEINFENLVQHYVPEMREQIYKYALSQGMKSNDPMLSLLHLTGFFNTVAQIIPDRMEEFLGVVVDLTEKIRADIRVEGGKEKESFMITLDSVLAKFLAEFKQASAGIKNQGSYSTQAGSDSIAVVVGENLNKHLEQYFKTYGQKSKTSKFHDIGIFLFGVAATLFASGLHHFFF